MEEIGVKKIGTQNFKSIDGKILRREIGEAKIKIAGREASTIVVFAKPDDAKVLGVYALEGLRLEYDPIKDKLRPSKFALAL